MEWSVQLSKCVMCSRVYCNLVCAVYSLVFGVQFAVWSSVQCEVWCIQCSSVCAEVYSVTFVVCSTICVQGLEGCQGHLTLLWHKDRENWWRDAGDASNIPFKHHFLIPKMTRTPWRDAILTSWHLDVILTHCPWPPVFWGTDSFQPTDASEFSVNLHELCLVNAWVFSL